MVRALKAREASLREEGIPANRASKIAAAMVAGPKKNKSGKKKQLVDKAMEVSVMGCLREMVLVKKVVSLLVERECMLEVHGVVKHDLPRNWGNQCTERCQKRQRWWV